MTGNKNKKLIIAFMCPALAVMIFFFALPVAMTIFYSFTNLSLTGSKAANLNLWRDFLNFPYFTGFPAP